jgi:hypothetical protein
MIRVISSPSISTTGFLTLIFAMAASKIIEMQRKSARGEQSAIDR